MNGPVVSSFGWRLFQRLRLASRLVIVAIIAPVDKKMTGIFRIQKSGINCPSSRRRRVVSKPTNRMRLKIFLLGGSFWVEEAQHLNLFRVDSRPGCSNGFWSRSRAVSGISFWRQIWSIKKVLCRRRASGVSWRKSGSISAVRLVSIEIKIAVLLVYIVPD